MKDVLAKANPNRHGLMRLIRYTDTSYETPAEYEINYVVEESDGYEAEFDTGAEARAHFDAQVKRLSDLPNYEAQAAYDAEWGTDNGYAPWQFQREY